MRRLLYRGRNENNLDNWSCKHWRVRVVGGGLVLTWGKAEEHSRPHRIVINYTKSKFIPMRSAFKAANEAIKRHNAKLRKGYK